MKQLLELLDQSIEQHIKSIKNLYRFMEVLDYGANNKHKKDSESIIHLEKHLADSKRVGRNNLKWAFEEKYGNYQKRKASPRR